MRYAISKIWKPTTAVGANWRDEGRGKKYALAFAGLLLLFVGCRAKAKFVTLETEMGRVRVRLFGDAAGQVSVFEDLMVASDTVFFGQIVRNKWAAVGMGFDKNWPENLRATAIVKTGRPHLTGALTMMNLPKTSTAPPLPPRFYIVLGQTQTEETLARFGGEMPKERRKKYLEKGGQPEWDGYATVFGEVVEGMDVLERIAAVPTDKDHRPLRPLPIQFSNH